MSQIKLGSVLLAIFLFSFLYSSAQPAPSLYSSNGIGSIKNRTFIGNMGMGGGGYAYYNPSFMNSLNPAVFINNEYTNFEAAFFMESKTYDNMVNDNTAGGGGLLYLSLGFPILRDRWNTQVVLRPYSAVNYRLTNSSQEEGFITPTTTSFEGSGGLSNLSFNNSVRIYKGLSLGLGAHYNFGSIVNSEVISVGQFVAGADTIRSAYRSSLSNTTSISDFSFNAGIFYRKFFKNNYYINFGAAYDLQANMTANRTVRLQKLNAAGNPIRIGLDTLNQNILFRDSVGTISIPNKLGAGIAVGKRNKFVVTADFTMQDWTQYREYGVANTNAVNAWSAHLGAELIPDINSLDSYFKRATYRFGARLEKQPFMINSTEIFDFGINLGTSLPLLRFSVLNIALEAGQIGINQTSLVRESYVRINLGFAMNDAWFIRQRLD
jgi:hypothetical protein